MSTLNALRPLFVLNAAGDVDVDATVNKFRDLIVAAAAEHRNDLDTIGVAVHALFDRFPGAFIQVDAIKTMTLQALNVEMVAIGEVSDRIHKFVQDNTADTKNRKDGLTASGNAPVFVRKLGKGGGFARLADLPAPAPAAAK